MTSKKICQPVTFSWPNYKSIAILKFIGIVWKSTYYHFKEIFLCLFLAIADVNDSEKEKENSAKQNKGKSVKDKSETTRGQRILNIIYFSFLLYCK